MNKDNKSNWQIQKDFSTSCKLLPNKNNNISEAVQHANMFDSINTYLGLNPIMFNYFPNAQRISASRQSLESK